MKIQKLINVLEKNGIVIEEQQFELFEYSVEEVFHQMMIYLSILILGVILHRFKETIEFLVMFPLLRKFSGGSHEVNRKRCYLMTIFTYVMALATTILVDIYLLSFLAFICGSYVCKHAPFEHPRNTLNLHQKEQYFEVSRKIVLCTYGVCTIILLLYRPICPAMIFTIIILNGGNLIMQTKKNIIWGKILRVLTTLILIVGTSTIRGTCNSWYYQSDISHNLRKFADE